MTNSLIPWHAADFDVVVVAAAVVVVVVSIAKRMVEALLFLMFAVVVKLANQKVVGCCGLVSAELHKRGDY